MIEPICLGLFEIENTEDFVEDFYIAQLKRSIF